MERVAPLRLAEEWDNVGLLVGDADAPVKKVMTCLTVTPSSVREAIDQQSDLIVSHHPFPFRPLKTITTGDQVGSMLLDLIRNGIAVYCAHTAFDSASAGINEMICDRLKLQNIEPLVPMGDSDELEGAGRVGRFHPATDLQSLIERVKQNFGLKQIRCCGQLDAGVKVIAAACGSGGSFLQHAATADCDTFITGEASFHTLLDAEAMGITLVLLGHYASERFAVEVLAERLQQQFPDLQIWSSTKESDPIRWI